MKSHAIAAVIAVVLVLSTSASQVSAQACNTFAAACTVNPGHLAVVQNNVIILVTPTTSNYFKVPIDGDTTDQVSIVTGVYFGDVTVYVTDDNTAPSADNHKWASDDSGQPDRVVIPGAEITGQKTLNVQVVDSAFTGNSLYSMVVNAAGIATVLTDGVSLRDTVDAGKFNYYTFDTTSATKPLSLILTPLSGDPDIFVSLTDHHPNHLSHQWAAQSPQGDVITIDASHHALGTTYYIAVYGFQRSEFTLLARMDSSITLNDGVPQHDSALAGESRFYEFHVGDHDQPMPVDIEVQVTDGYLDVFITSNKANEPVVQPTPQQFDIKVTASWLASGNVRIEQGTAGFLSDRGQYNILVHALQGANYTINAASDYGISTLQDGVPANGLVNPGEYEYFQFSVPSNLVDVDIALTPLSGDPDIFVSCSKHLNHTDMGIPSRLPGHFTWASTRSAATDSIFIDHTAVNACNGPNEAGGGTFYIAIYGYKLSTYTLTAASDNGMPTLLLDGFPQRGLVLANHYRYYNMYLGEGHEDLTISLTALVGDPDLFVNVNASKPTIFQHQYSAAGTRGLDTVTISAAELCTRCWIDIAVFGYRVSQYVLSGTTSQGYRTLQDGVPVQDTVGRGEYEYFKYTLHDPGMTLKIVLTSISGDADLFVSQAHTMPGIPTMFNQTWYSMHVGGLFDEVNIENAPTGLYYVGVRGFKNSTFTINAHAVELNHAEMVTLILGQPQSGSINDTDGWAYYQLLMSGQDTSLTISATPFSGVIGVYVNLCDGEEMDRCDGSHGGVDYRPKANNAGIPTATWSSDTSITRESVQIANAGCAAGTTCSYIIGVYGHTPASFSVSASSDTDVLMLQEGVPHRGYVNHYENMYYSFTVTEEHKDVVITATRFTGDPDLYISVCGPQYPSGIVVPCNPRPTNHSATWASRMAGSGTVVIPYGSAKSCLPSAERPCQYFIDVYGFRSSSFSIMATLHSDVPTVLVDGVPQHGHVNRSVSNQYVLDVPAGQDLIDIVVTPEYGDPDVFVSLDLEKPGLHHWQYKSLAAFNSIDHIQIKASDQTYKNSLCRIELPCRVYIAVYGVFPSDYTISATTDQAATTLQEAVTVQGSVGFNSWQYYQFTVDVPDTTLSFVVTPVNGDPDVYVSTGAITRPTRTTAQWSSTRIGADVVDIYVDDNKRCAPPCNYYIGVLGFESDASYTIVAKQQPSEPTQLVDGVPTQGFLNQSMTDQYIITVPPHQSGVDVVLTTSYGDADLYATVGGGTPSQHNFQYLSMAATGEDRLTIRAFDHAYQQHCSTSAPCQVRIAVRSFYACAYSLVASTSNTSVLLLANQPLRGQLAAHNTAYYTYHNNQPGAAISVVLTALGGDPDMYISTSDPRPTVLQSNWRSMRVGSDVIDIFPGEIGTCQAPCDYYIAVSAFTNATFTIVAGNFSGMPTRLVVGQPQAGMVGRGHTQRYSTHMDTGVQRLEVSITPQTGDPDLFVTLGNGPLPTPAHYHYRSLASWGQDLVAILPTDEAYQMHCMADVPCTVNVAVVAFQGSQYTVTATTLNGLARLQSGVPFRDSVERNEYAYFVYTPDDYHTDITFFLTPFSGDPDMYISISNPRPNRGLGNYTWRSERLTYDRVIVGGTDMRRCMNSPCHYYIGITGYDGPASYQLLVRPQSDTRPTSLIQGQPQRGHAAYHALTWYAFGVAEDQIGTTQFVVTTVNNPVGIYVVAPNADGTYDAPQWHCVAVDHTPQGTLCTRYSVVGGTWSSLSSTTGATVSINPTDSAACHGCTYLIGVASLTEAAQGADFIITGGFKGGMTILQDGIPQRARVTNAEYKYYQMVIDEPRTDVSVAITTFFGDAELFLSTDFARPNQTAYTWRSFSSFSDVVFIQYQQLADCEAKVEVGGSCMLYIAVRGTTGNCSYSITGSLDQSFTAPILLVDGSPETGFVNHTKYAYYMAHVVVPEDTRLTVSLTPEYGDPDLFVTTDGSEPGPSNYQFKSTSWTGAVQDIVTIEPGKPHYCYHCVLNIAVYGFTTSQFTITYETSSSISTLQTGVPTFGVITGDTYKYYRIDVNNPDTDVSFTVTSNGGGNPLLFASPVSSDAPDVTLPTVQDHVWQGSTFGGNVISIPHTDPHACFECSYILGVHANRNTSFYVVATMSSNEGLQVTQLIDGQQQTGAGTDLEFKYYYLSVRDSEYHTVQFTATPQTGNVELYLTNNYVPGVSPDSALPSRENYVWSTFNPTITTTRYSISVAPHSAGWDAGKNVYTLAVLCNPASRFVVTGTTSEVSQSLALGQVSSSHQLSQGSNAHFYLYLSRNDGPVRFVVTPLSGQPRLLVSTNVQQAKPYCETVANAITCHNYTYISTGQDDIQVTVPGDAYTEGSYIFLGVYADTATTFSISAWFDTLELSDGHPQVASTSAEIICPQRSPNGVCSGSPSSWQTMQAAFFHFQTMAEGAGNNRDVAVTVSQPCEFNQESRNDCGDELEFFVFPCNTGTCNVNDEYPSSEWTRFRQVVSEGSATIFIPIEHPFYCDPSLGLCNYYVGVYPVCAPGAACGPHSFQISYSSSSPTVITHNCMVNNNCQSPLATLAASGSRDYEMYVGDTPLDLTISVESCSGDVSLYVCNSHCSNPFQPGPGNSQYASNTGQTGYALVHISGALGTYYADVHDDMGGGALFQITAGTGDFPTLEAQGTVTVSGVTDTSVTLTWPTPKLQTAFNVADATGTTYLLYTVKGQFPSDVVSTTACGLENYAGSSADAAPTTISAGTNAINIGTLDPDTTYLFVLVGVCEGSCSETRMTTVYTVAPVTTKTASMGAGVIILIIAAVVLIPTAIFCGYRYRHNKALEKQLQYESVDVSGIDAVVNRPVTNYAPLLDDEE